MKRGLLTLSVSELAAWCKEKSLPSFRAQQIYDWLWKKWQFDVEKMSNLSLDLRKQLTESFQVSPLELVRVQDSHDLETRKFLWKLHDGSLVESVLIIAPDRKTVCVSSQVGCPARCAFCASGQKGLIRNLSWDEIVAQVLLTQAYLQKSCEQVTNVVYMGMGEPMENYEQVVKSIHALIDPDKFGMSQRRVTVSTVGVVEGIYRFADENLKVNLVLSLHAPNQVIRQKIIPYARKYPLEKVLKAMDAYFAKTGREITYEYTLLEGINDAPEHAQELVRLLRGKQCTVNLIPYNPIIGLRLKRPSHERIMAFREVLDSARMVNTCRYTKGVDIAAACGQLALQVVPKESARPQEVAENNQDGQCSSGNACHD